MGLGHAHDHGSGAGAAAAGGLDRRTHRRALRLALSLTVIFTAVELTAALLTGSLALLADAVHMLSDNLSLGLALLALGLASHPPTPQRSFGLGRAEILAALVNGIALLAVAGWIIWEAIGRLSEPSEVPGLPILLVAAAGLLVNLIAARILAPGARESLNLAGAMRHVLADLAGSVGVIVAAIVVLTTGWQQADPLIGAMIAVLIALSAAPIIRDSVRVLLEQAPAGLDAGEVGRAMAAAPGIVEVHDLHVWTITSGFPALAAHVLVAPGDDCHARRRELEELLRERFGIDHTTLQLDHTPRESLLQLGGLDSPGEPPPGPEPVDPERP
jgi:cobalt-zinc-cadmium efflux system protein